MLLSTHSIEKTETDKKGTNNISKLKKKYVGIVRKTFSNKFFMQPIRLKNVDVSLKSKHFIGRKNKNCCK